MKLRFLFVAILSSLVGACGSGGGSNDAAGTVEFTVADSLLNISGQDTASIGVQFKPLYVNGPQSQGKVLQVSWQFYEGNSRRDSNTYVELVLLFSGQGVVEAMSYEYDDRENGFDYFYVVDCVIPAYCEDIKVDVVKHSVALGNVNLDNSLTLPSVSTAPISLQGNLHWNQ